MPLSKNIIRANVTHEKILDFVPPALNLGTPQVAIDFLENSLQRKNDFKMSDAIKEQTGINVIEEREINDRVEKKVIEKLQAIQEPAYQKAYELGLEEGRKYAFELSTQTIDQRINDLDKLIQEIKDLKSMLVSQNEAHIVKLSFYMAKKIAMAEINEKPDYVLNVIRQAILLSQSEEQVTVRVPAVQFEFLEEVKKEANREFEFLKKVTFEPNDDMTIGGCVIQTNYGEVDARLEERVQSLWDKVLEVTPKVTDKISGES